MNSLNNKMYLLNWSGEFPKYNYTSSTLSALCKSENDVWEYLQEKVNEGWVVLETTVTEVN